MRFIILRVSLLQADPGSLFAKADLEDGARFEKIRVALSDSVEATHRGKAYRTYDVAGQAVKLDDQELPCVVGKIGTPAQAELTQEDDLRPGHLVARSAPDTEWVHFAFCGVGRQYMLVERKQSFFNGTPRGMAEIVKKIISRHVEEDGWEVQVEPIAVRGSFWETIGEMQGLESVRLEVFAPNMFRNRSEIAAIVNQQVLLHNANKFAMEVSSENGTLRYPKAPSTEDEIDYIEGGCGTWTVVGRDQTGSRVTRSSGVDAVLHVDVPDAAGEQEGILTRLNEIITAALRLFRP